VFMVTKALIYRQDRADRESSPDVEPATAKGVGPVPIKTAPSATDRPISMQRQVAAGGSTPVAQPGLQERESSAQPPAATIIETDIPARLDRLPFGRFHARVVIALGITWILDGLEVTLAGSLASALTAGSGLGLTNTEVGLAGSAYLGGAVLGAVGFGWLTDRLGRRKLFFITLTLYLAATAATALSWSGVSYALFRFLTGAGIGGEYAAINTAIQELIPARLRGATDLVINGSFWIGAALGAVGSMVLLDPAIVDPALGWRLAFLIGAALGLVIFAMRIWIPESPRWLMLHGRIEDAQAIIRHIEEMSGSGAAPDDLPRVRLRARAGTPLAEVMRTLFVTYRRRAWVGLALMAAQAFFYNAIFFTYALILAKFYGISADRIGRYIVPFAVGNFLGPLLLGRLFDTLGRRIMIGSTFALSGILLAATGYLFSRDLLSAETQTLAWMIVFFFASAAASSAYLTVGETFPLEIRALSIAVFYACGTAIGGVAAPWLFGAIIDTGSRASVAAGYLLAAALMIAAGVIQWRWGIAAECKSLETVARPLSYVDS
jgi:MFS family permease